VGGLGIPLRPQAGEARAYPVQNAEGRGAVPAVGVGAVEVLPLLDLVRHGVPNGGRGAAGVLWRRPPVGAAMWASSAGEGGLWLQSSAEGGLSRALEQ